MVPRLYQKFYLLAVHLGTDEGLSSILAEIFAITLLNSLAVMDGGFSHSR